MKKCLQRCPLVHVLGEVAAESSRWSLDEESQKEEVRVI